MVIHRVYIKGKKGYFNQNHERRGKGKCSSIDRGFTYDSKCWIKIVYPIKENQRIKGQFLAYTE